MVDLPRGSRNSGPMTALRFARTVVAAAGLAAFGCSASSATYGETQTVTAAFCAEGGAEPSTSGAELLARPAGSGRAGCVSGVYELKYNVSGGGKAYTTTAISRLELRAGSARAAVRCTFEGPSDNPEDQRGPRTVTATIEVPLRFDETGIEFLETAVKSPSDPYGPSYCDLALRAARWPFCVATTSRVGTSVEPPEGADRCITLGSDGSLKSLLRQGIFTSTGPNFGLKIGD